MSFKKYLSFLYPITIEKFNTKFNGVMELKWVNGVKILDSKSANYSYGSLQTILKRGLQRLKWDHSIQEILVLGLGGGSIIPTIRLDFNVVAHIDLIDIDSDLIKIARAHFQIDNYEDVEVYCEDAMEYVDQTKKKYDLVIVDLFIDNIIPTQFIDEQFIYKLDRLLNINGKILFNTIRINGDRSNYNNLYEFFSKMNYQIESLLQIEGENDLLLSIKTV